MSDLPKDELALASYVALRIDDIAIQQGCVGWVESRDETCQRPPLERSILCKRHHSVAVVRRDKALEAAQQQQAHRKAYRAENLPKWRAERELIEAQMEHYGSPATNDRAAFGGQSHPSIRRKQLQQLSDTNVRRMADLSKRWQRLTELIGDK